jgi:hypothetical protein
LNVSNFGYLLCNGGFDRLEEDPMKKLALITTGVALAFGLSSPVFAAPAGFGEEKNTTQGGSGKTTSANPDNEGQTETTTTGPRGALKNDKETPNQETNVTNLPGKNR